MLATNNTVSFLNNLIALINGTIDLAETLCLTAIFIAVLRTVGFKINHLFKKMAISPWAIRKILFPSSEFSDIKKT